MARHGYHSYEAGGMPMGHLPRRRPMGMDPNYRGDGYGGQRMHRGDDRAAYGRYREEHARELAPHGGPRGRNTGAGQLREFGPTRPTGPEPMVRGNRGGPRGGGQIPLRSDRAYRQSGAQVRGRGYDASYAPVSTERMPNPGIRMGSPRGGRNPQPGPSRQGGQGGRSDMMDASRPLRYDQGFNRYGGKRGGGFSEGFLGSGF
jgi:hypothetical protein